MTRKEMLKKLNSLRYNLIWSSSSWEEIGFTERPLWINNKGWGYIMCDEPCAFGEIEAISDNKWKIVKEKLQNKKLKFEDIEKTSLKELIYHCFNVDDEEYDVLNNGLSGLLALPDKLGRHIYWANTFDGFEFFNSEEEMYEAIDFRDCYEWWEEMDNKTLEIWIVRITSELGDIFNK